MRPGKYHQVGAGSRSRSQARAERAARRSQKRADERAWTADELNDEEFEDFMTSLRQYGVGDVRIDRMREGRRERS